MLRTKNTPDQGFDPSLKCCLTTWNKIHFFAIVLTSNKRQIELWKWFFSVAWCLSWCLLGRGYALWVNRVLSTKTWNRYCFCVLRKKRCANLEINTIIISVASTVWPSLPPTSHYQAQPIKIPQHFFNYLILVVTWDLRSEHTIQTDMSGLVRCRQSASKLHPVTSTHRGQLVVISNKQASTVDSVNPRDSHVKNHVTASHNKTICTRF